MSTIQEQVNELLIRRRGFTLQETTLYVKSMIEMGIQTGSRIFGVQNADGSSDHDVVVRPPSRGNTAARIWGSIIWGHNGFYLDNLHYDDYRFYSAYVVIDNEFWNIIIPQDSEEYGRWKYATAKMKDLSISSPSYRERIRDKTYRVELFEEYKAEYTEDK